MLPFLWTKYKLISLIRKGLSFWYGFDISIIFSLFRHMVKKNWKSSYHPNIKFTQEFNKESIPILDLKVSLSGGQLTTYLHIKSTDKHQYLHYISAHRDDTKRSIVFSQALRVSRTDML